MGRSSAGKRPKRVAHRIQSELARLIQTAAADPRLALVTVTDVRVDRELEFANIWVCTADGSSDNRDDVLAALEHARGFLRSELAARLRVRRTPQLIFHWDFVPERAARIEGLLDTLRNPVPRRDDTTES
ncbi:MAG: 30S ribosome-binding factor RbfA [Anaerolineales bacterium]